MFFQRINHFIAWIDDKKNKWTIMQFASSIMEARLLIGITDF